MYCTVQFDSPYHSLPWQCSTRVCVCVYLHSSCDPALITAEVQTQPMHLNCLRIKLLSATLCLWVCMCVCESLGMQWGFCHCVLWQSTVATGGGQIWISKVTGPSTPTALRICWCHTCDFSTFPQIFCFRSTLILLRIHTSKHTVLGCHVLWGVFIDKDFYTAQIVYFIA